VDRNALIRQVKGCAKLKLGVGARSLIKTNNTLFLQGSLVWLEE